MPTVTGLLTYVCAAPGTGKTTVLPALVAAALGEVIIDIDELLEDDALLGVPIATPTARTIWPAYNRMWERIAMISRRAGYSVIMLTQVPDPADLEPGSSDSITRWFGWDCPDPLRVNRLRARDWSAELIEDAVADAAACRRLLPGVLVTTDGQTPAEIAELILDRVRRGPHLVPAADRRG